MVHILADQVSYVSEEIRDRIKVLKMICSRCKIRYNSNTSGFWPRYAAVRLVYPSFQAYYYAKRSLRGPRPSLHLTSEKFAKDLSLGRKIRKKGYSSFHIVQQFNYNWHCEFKCFLGQAKTKNNPSHPPSLVLSTPIPPPPISPPRLPIRLIITAGWHRSFLPYRIKQTGEFNDN